IDTLRALMMAIVHDLVEIDAGDTFFYGLTEDKTIQEQKAIERLTGLLPSAVGEELKTIWTEFEAGQSPEAKFVSALDRFLPIYSNMQNDGYSWKNHGVSVDQVRARCEKPISDGLPELWKLTDALLSESVAKGQFTARE
ncbi:MAG: HD domain-containing protein, partial [Proteobacteria bacterium]